MLHAQEFLRSGRTLKDLHQKYDIDVHESERLPIVVFNYRMLSPLQDFLVQQSRGLVLEKDTWDVVSKSIDAFFEPNNPLARNTVENFDWSTGKAMEKLDGALVCLYYYKDEWHVCTRFSPDGHWLVWSMNAAPSPYTWLEYVKVTLIEMGTTWNEFTSKLDPNIFYTFELCGPENRVVVVYTKRSLVLVAAVRKDTLEELDIYSMPFPDLKPKVWDVRSMRECWDLVSEHPEPYNHEGFVALDASFRRLKFRNPNHVGMMQNYSIDDEASALRELRKLDVEGTYTVTVTVTSNVDTFIDTLDSTIVNQDEQDKTSFAGKPVEIFSTFFGKMLGISRWASDQYQEMQRSDFVAQSLGLEEIWPEALEKLRAGQNMSYILDTSPEDELLEAIRRYEKMKSEGS